MHTVTSSLRMLNSECAYMAVGRTPAPQHRHVLLNARVPHLSAIQPAASVSTQRPRGACNDDAYPFHCPTLSAPSTSDHATAPRCIPSPPLGVASNHLNASTLMLMNLRAKQVTRDAHHEGRSASVSVVKPDLVCLVKAGNVCDLDLTCTLSVETRQHQPHRTETCNTPGDGSLKRKKTASGLPYEIRGLQG